MRRWWRWTNAAALGCTLVAASVLSGQTAGPAVRGDPPDSALVRFLSSEVTRQMKALDIPGAVVVVVRAGRVVMNAPFGQASVSPAVPVDADSTSFRIASVAKVFTALGVLRVVASGRVGLETDLRSLAPDVAIRGPIGGPVTLHQLLTHTGGFEDRIIGYFNPLGAEPEPLGAYLARALPPRTRRATDLPAYSNHGYALAGYIVERITRVPFRDYVRDSVLTPLGMTATRFVLAPKDTIGMHLASEYRSTGERRVFRSGRAYPAGSIATTGADMARFLIALSRGLHGDSTSPIPPMTARQLVSPAVTYHPGMPPMGYGLNGVRLSEQIVWMKGGASSSHSAVVAFIPATDIGIFIAVNRQEPLLWDRVLPAFVARFFADTSRRPDVRVSRASAVSGVRGLGGTYLLTRAPLRSAEAIADLAMQITVSPTASGVRIDGPGEMSGTYVAGEGAVFERSDGRQVAFRIDAGGRSTHLFSVMQAQPFTFERIGLLRTAPVQLGALVAGTVLAIVAGLTALRQRARLAPVWARTATIALPFVEIATVAAALVLARDADALLEGPTVALRIALALCTVLGIAAMAQMSGAVVLGRRATLGRPSRAIYWAGAVGGAMMLWFLSAAHLVGPW